MEGFEEINGYYSRDGVAKTRGFKNLCKKKLCIISADMNILFDLALKASDANDCYRVLIRKDSRLSVFVAEFAFTNDSSVGDAWSRYEFHPRVWAIVKDDAFCDSFKDKIRKY